MPHVTFAFRDLMHEAENLVHYILTRLIMYELLCTFKNAFIWKQPKLPYSFFMDVPAVFVQSSVHPTF